MTAAIRRAAALIIALGTFALASWIVLPAPTYFLLTFGVGAPEVSPWLVLAALVAMSLTIGDVRMRTGARVTFAFATAALLLSVTPLARFPATAARLDETMRSALGRDFLRDVPAAKRATMRATPLIWKEFVTGIDMGEEARSLRLDRGISVASIAGSDGGVLTADVYRPATSGRFPTVVQIYGGAWQRGAPASNGNFARWLAARGYVVFAIDYRHAPHARWPAQLEDIRTDLAWIRDHAAAYDADTSRVALIGRSAGAHLALLAAYTSGPIPVRAVISYYGPTDLADAYRHPPRPDPLRVRDVMDTFIGGSPDEYATQYRDASPITWATRPLPATLLVYGGRDHVVEPRYGARLRDCVALTGTPVAYLEIPWAEHAFDEVFNGPSSQLALYHTERFLAWALSPHSAPVQTGALTGPAASSSLQH